jgi:F0F1-type ATP synthase assembly protein I
VTDSKKMSEGDKKPTEKVWWADALAMFARLSVWIAAPVVIASLAGNYLDDKYDTSPWLLMACVGVSFVFTMIILVRETMKSFQDIERNSENKKN